MVGFLGEGRSSSSLKPRQKEPTRAISKFLLLSFIVFAYQLYQAGTAFWSAVPFDNSKLDVPVVVVTRLRDDADMGAAPINSSDGSTKLRPMAACLMVKDDNDLLYEWLAYHFTTLVPPGHPFYVVVGSDVGNTQNLTQVLHRWDKIPELHYWILHADDFVNIHGNYDSLVGQNKLSEEDMSPDELKKYHHHALIIRQKGFLTACSLLMKSQGAEWTLYADTDEFLALQPLNYDDMTLKIDGMGHDSITNSSFRIRQRLAESMDEEKSLLELLDELQVAGHNDTCLTFPRLLVGALENRTCPPQFGIDIVQQLAQSQLQDRYAYMSTLRFVQHAPKGDFAYSKFGKVLMDLSRIANETIEMESPRNIHRPYATHCGPAGGAHFPNAFAFLLHYIGSWERYASRSDNRRNRREWEERAFVDNIGGEVSAVCTSRVHTWYPRFIRRVGENNAKILLGMEVQNNQG